MGVTYYPDAKFAVCRAYVSGFQMSISPPWEVDSKANPLRYKVVLPYYTAWIEVHLRPDFFAWNSNVYTLDQVITRMNYYDTYGNANDVDTYSLGWSSMCNVSSFALHCFVPGSSGLLQVNLPQPDKPYWLSFPPCPEILA